MNLGLTKQPFVSGIGFILTGLGGIFAAPTLYLKTNQTWRRLGAAVLIAAALIWAAQTSHFPDTGQSIMSNGIT